MKPRYIVLTGLSGSGKSTVASLLAEHEKNAVIINSDTVRKELFPQGRTYSREETKAVIEEMNRRAERMLREGRTVIKDALHTTEASRVREEAYARAGG